MEPLVQELKMAWRSVLRRPGLSLAAILCAALGIGLCTTVFSACYAMLMRPFPFADADGLLVVAVNNSQRGIIHGDLSYLDFSDLKTQSTSFSEVAGYFEVELTLGANEEPERIRGAGVSANLFKVLGIAPVLGRNFLPEEDSPGAPGALILSHSLWQRSFLGDPQVLDRVVQIDNSPYRIVGVMPPDFQFPTREQVWIPLTPRLAGHDRKVREVSVLARLGTGRTLPEAQAEVAAIGQRLMADFPEIGTAWQYQAITLRERHVSPGMQTMSWTLLGSSFFVLMIACANVANLLIAQAERRSREISVRVALGASRRRVLLQFLMESLILAVVGGLIGLALAAVGVHLLLLLFPASNPVPYWMTFSLDLPVLAFTAVVTLLTCILSGLAPAARASSTDHLGLLISGGHATTGRSRLRSALVVAEVALSLSLLIAAALFVRSFYALKDADSGFEENSLTTFRIHLSGDAFQAQEERVQLVQETLRRLEALPGVSAAYASTLIPLAGGSASSAIEILGQTVPIEEKPRISWASISPNFFSTLQVPIESGRGFNESEAWTKANVVVVNRRLADRFFPGQDPVGQQIRLENVAGSPWLKIIGVSRDFKTVALDRPAVSHAFLPYSFQSTRRISIVLRAQGDLGQSLQAARKEIHALNPGIPVFDTASMTEVREAAIWQFQLVARLFLVFGVLALILAAIGLYGVISYMVGQRRREIGIRMALGAQNRPIVLLILRQGMSLALMGLACGLVVTFILTRILASFLYGISATDPVSFGGLALFLLLVSAAANYLPARRALQIDPIEALRQN